MIGYSLPKVENKGQQNKTLCTSTSPLYGIDTLVA